MKALSRPSTPARYRLSARGQALQVEADVGVEHGGRRQLVDVGGVQVAGAQVAAGQAEVPVRTLPVGRQHQGVLRLADHLGAVDDAQLGVARGVAAAQVLGAVVGVGRIDPPAVVPAIAERRFQAVAFHAAEVLPAGR
ncbi:hypothetical protein G6F62_014676 [Rhizopus arrhizus]|nr:hypothetical protein G6F62_014676 [Rhizopus arrhizus]